MVTTVGAIKDGSPRDLHILRYFTSLITVSEGRVTDVTDPVLSYCPLAAHFYKGLKAAMGADTGALKDCLKDLIETKIREFGFFTEGRRFSSEEAAVRYGASEIMMAALLDKTVDAAVVVCDGAGTVVTTDGRVVQGIGGRMNSLVRTSPIGAVAKRLKDLGCVVVFDDARIDQAAGALKAIESGNRRIAVTVSGRDSGRLKEIAELRSRTDADITILAVCNTGISGEAVGEVCRHADLVWSCASAGIREKAGPLAILQVSRSIPVFALTRRGLDMVAAYSGEAECLRGLDPAKQYLISNSMGRLIRMRGFQARLSECELPSPPGNDSGWLV